MITYIHRSKLEPHPDNPRKELGDLSELAASIQKQGLLQNLTVIPSPVTPDKYRIVIGHRRFAASEQAGLEELPCIIDEKMTYPEQIAVMMSENIQRNDLTIAEKVGGVQMMMELGMNVNEISGNTGISDTTVRRYAKISKLGSGSLAQAEQRGATLMQFAEICEIEDEDLRNEALEKAGTSDFNHVMYKVRVARARKERVPLIARKLCTFASEIDKEDYSRYMWLEYFRYTDDDCLNKIDAFKPSKGKRYAFCIREYDVVLYEELPNYDDAKEQDRREAAERLRERFAHEAEIAASFRELRDVFMTDLSLKGKEEAAKRFVLWVLTRSEYLECAKVGGRFDYCCLPERENKGYTNALGIDDDELSQIPERETLLALVLVAYDRISGSNLRAMDSVGKPKQDLKTLHGLYRHLEALGYPISTDEQAWLDGTHECFSYPHEESEVTSE